MMFFVSAKRLQAILDADRKEQAALRKLEEMNGVSFRRLAGMFGITTPPLPLSTNATGVLAEIDQRVAAKKATTKAARPPRKPRNSK